VRLTKLGFFLVAMFKLAAITLALIVLTVAQARLLP
jgi:hypothetical protein